MGLVMGGVGASHFGEGERGEDFGAGVGAPLGEWRWGSEEGSEMGGEGEWGGEVSDSAFEAIGDEFFVTAGEVGEDGDA